MPSPKLRAVLASPLLHFFVLGGLVFAYFNLLNPPSSRGPRDDELQLSATEAQRLMVDFMSTRHRAPNPDELHNMIRDWAVEEASVREAIALGLDKGDTMIRNRLRNKVEFLAEAPAAALTPDDATLTSYYQANARRYSEDGVLSFTQVLLPDGAGPERVQAVRADLQKGTDPASLSNSALLPPQVDAMPIPTVERIFGKDFGETVTALPLEQWSGPVQSGFGFHLVRLKMHRDGTLPPLAEVRDRVLTEWRADEARKLRETYIQNLLSRYKLNLPSFEDEVK
ncbi:peptidyl-prolyl cis-trans isomerase [Paracoccus ravus]|uniref:peptidylprolyl isomerase n=1 Tax=Paracoccus ravus TaxID=2447760 RepID=UPI00106E718F|nr:peptidylprolyl isomerase [Paracoccus ravus]